MASIGEQGMLTPQLCSDASYLHALVDGGFVQRRELVNEEGFRASLRSDTSYLNALGGWWMVDSWRMVSWLAGQGGGAQRTALGIVKCQKIRELIET